jgi:CRP-like cAMP-binding protein
MSAQDIFTCRQHFSLWMQGLCAPWAEVIHLGTRLTLPKDQDMFGDGSMARGLFFIEKGVLRFVSCDETGQQAILFYVTENNLFGDAALFNRMPIYALFQAVEDCVLHFIDEATVREVILPGYPHLAENLFEFMAYKIGVLLHHHCEIVSPDVRGKICRLLFDIARYCGYSKTISPKITQQEMAQVLGLHRATFSRVIAELKREGVLHKVTKKEIVINDLKALAQYANKPFAL